MLVPQGSALSVVVGVADHVSVLCMCVSCTHLASPLAAPANEKAAAKSLSLGWRPPESQDAPGWAPATATEESPGPGACWGQRLYNIP